MKTNKSIRVAVVSHGWLGDSLICTAAASSLFEEYGYEVDFFCKWRQLAEILKDDTRFRTYTYKDSKIGNFLLNRRLKKYSKIIYEPFPWSHNEPLSNEIRHLLVRFSAMRDALMAFIVPIAFRSMHGICTRPPIGSQVSPRLCSMPISAAFSTCSGVPPRASVRPAAAIDRRRTRMQHPAAPLPGRAGTRRFLRPERSCPPGP